MLCVKLLTDPNILFCDEPTTGLDSFSALSVMQSLKCLTQQGNAENSISLLESTEMDILPIDDSWEHEQLCNKAIICSIHQPTSAVFECFSHVILMKAGQITFQGSVQEAHNAFYKSVYCNIFVFFSNKIFLLVLAMFVHPYVIQLNFM